MRLDDYRESSNVEEGRGGGLGFGGGMGGGPLGLIIGLIASRFGLGGIVVVGIAMLLFGMNPLSLVGLGGGQQVATQGQPGPGGAAAACGASGERTFACRVLASTEDTWAKLFAAQGQRYQPTTMVLYDRGAASGCGAASSAMGPFYCPSDQRVYLDTSFFDELVTKFGAAGDFAQAYVIAHEVGHHIQTITGISDRVRAGQEQASQAEANALQVRMELQADCYAGVWAANNRDRIEPGDVEEGLRAAQAIGDDTLQRGAGRTPMPDSFTHGSSAQRMTWLKRGLDTGDPAQCDTFAAGVAV